MLPCWGQKTPWRQWKEWNCIPFTTLLQSSIYPGYALFMTQPRPQGLASVCWLLPTFQRSHTSTDPYHKATALASPLALCISKSTDPTDHPVLPGVSRGMALLRCTQDPRAPWRLRDRRGSSEDPLTLTCCRDIGKANHLSASQAFRYWKSMRSDCTRYARVVFKITCQVKIRYHRCSARNSGYAPGWALTHSHKGCFWNCKMGTTIAESLTRYFYC